MCGAKLCSGCPSSGLSCPLGQSHHTDHHNECKYSQCHKQYVRSPSERLWLSITTIRFVFFVSDGVFIFCSRQQLVKEQTVLTCDHNHICQVRFVRARWEYVTHGTQIRVHITQLTQFVFAETPRQELVNVVVVVSRVIHFGHSTLICYAQYGDQALCYFTRFGQNRKPTQMYPNGY